MDDNKRQKNNPDQGNEDNPMTTADAGNLGEDETARIRGEEFYQEIGRKGVKNRGKNKDLNEDDSENPGQGSRVTSGDDEMEDEESIKT